MLPLETLISLSISALETANVLEEFGLQNDVISKLVREPWKQRTNSDLLLKWLGAPPGAKVKVADIAHM